MDTMQHLKALALEERAAVLAAEEGITPLQAYRNLKDRAFVANQVRRQYRDAR